MRALPRVLNNSLLAGLLLLASCNATRSLHGPNTAREGQQLIKEAALLTSADKGSSRQIAIAQIPTTGLPVFKTSQAMLTSAFIRQFGDGTVIDKVMVRQAPSEADEAPTYYLIGMGLHNGNFRAMALPLSSVGTALYLTPNAERYMLNGSGCRSCFFNFEGSRIIGSSCDDSAGGCMFKVLNDNTLFVSR